MTRLAIIAGRGDLPLQVAKSATARGYKVCVFPIDGQADANFEGFTIQPIRLGAMGQTRRYLSAHDCTELVLVGKVVWPSLGALRPDASALKLLGKLVRRGDDSILRIITDFFAEKGVKTLPVHMFLADRAMPSGQIAGPAISADGTAMIDIGADILKRLGESDVGQAVVVQNGRVLAIEAAEGTSAMLLRSTDLIDTDAGPAAFVKMQKTGQDQRLDTPFIGIETLECAVAAGVSIVAIEAGAVMLADDLQEMKGFCNKNNIIFFGMTATAQL